MREMQERPQILLMENVPQVVSEKFIGDFSKWLEFLESIGYTSKYEILNAKDYGVPQNRERCFMVSWQGDYFYDFPTPQKLLLRLKDMLEPEVDSRYYLSDEAAMRVLSTHTHRISGEISNTVRASGRGSTDRHAWDTVRIDDAGGDCQENRFSAHADGERIQRIWEPTDGCCCRTSGGGKADGVNLGDTGSFARGPLRDLSRTIRAEQHGAGVVLYGE